MESDRSRFGGDRDHSRCAHRRKDGVGRADDRARHVVKFLCSGAVLIVIATLSNPDLDDFTYRNAYRALVLGGIGVPLFRFSPP